MALKTKLTDTHFLIGAIIILILLFVFGKCKLVCGGFKLEGYSTCTGLQQIKDNQKSSECQGCAKIGDSCVVLAAQGSNSCCSGGVCQAPNGVTGTCVSSCTPSEWANGECGVNSPDACAACCSENGNPTDCINNCIFGTGSMNSKNQLVCAQPCGSGKCSSAGGCGPTQYCSTKTGECTPILQSQYIGASCSKVSSDKCEQSGAMSNGYIYDNTGDCYQCRAIADITQEGTSMSNGINFSSTTPLSNCNTIGLGGVKQFPTDLDISDYTGCYKSIYNSI